MSRQKPHSFLPKKYVDVMRQTQTSMNSSAEHTVNDSWNDEEIDASLRSEHQDFELLMARLPERHKWVNGRPSTKDEKIRQHVAQITKETQTGRHCKLG